MIFKRRARLPLSVDPNDPVAIAHEKEVLARENFEAASGSENELPTDVGFVNRVYGRARPGFGSSAGISVAIGPDSLIPDTPSIRNWNIHMNPVDPNTPEDFKERD